MEYMCMYNVIYVNLLQDMGMYGDISRFSGKV